MLKWTVQLRLSVRAYYAHVIKTNGKATRSNVSEI